MAWCNTFLSRRHLQARRHPAALRSAAAHRARCTLVQVNDLAEDLADGVLLINLLEIAFNKSLGHYNTTPRVLVRAQSACTPAGAHVPRVLRSTYPSTRCSCISLRHAALIRSAAARRAPL